MLPDYSILTSMYCMEIPDLPDEEVTEIKQELFEEQVTILNMNGFDYCGQLCKVHFFDSKYTHDCTRIMDIDEAVQCLAIKDGVDLVQFENSNYGFVAYYNGVENGFEIIKEVD